MEKKLRILAAGDLHGDLGVARKLSEKAKREKVDLVVLAGDVYGYDGGTDGILKSFERAGQRVLFVPGNCDFDEEVVDLCKAGKNLHGYYVTYEGVGFAGVGCANWKLSHDSGDLDLLKKSFGKMKAKRRVLVSHLHAEGTAAEFSGVAGESVLRRAALEFKPEVLISAHIHEAEGLRDRIGETRVVQVGKKGEVLEI
jgi:Icc-related predicted phosphoesterase